jgi:glutaredoxin
VKLEPSFKSFSGIDMKFVFRIFFKTLRIVIGPLMLLWEMLTRPKGVTRQPALQQALDEQCRSIVLYQYKTCPFCIKVRQELRRLSLKIDQLDAQQEGKNRTELVQGGGQAKVPCLKITDQAGNNQWLYESGEIISYLRGRFAAV